MSSFDDTKSINSSDYDSVSLSESIDGSPRKIVKKKKMGFFHRKKEEKISNTISLERGRSHFLRSTFYKSKQAHLISMNTTEVTSITSEMKTAGSENSKIYHQVAENGFHSAGGNSVYSHKKTSSIGSGTHQLEVRLRGGENLAPRDANGLSDPYVKFKVNGRTAYKSRSCKATLNPHWDENFHLPVNLNSDVRIRVYDKDFASRDDFMGEGSIDLKRLTNVFDDVIIDLEDEDTNEDLGCIVLEARLLSNFSQSPQQSFESIDSPLLERQASSLSISSETGKLTAGKDGSIRQRAAVVNRSRAVAIATVQLVSGSDIPARDTNGFSDPYVKLGVGKAKRRKSKICYKTLNPVWKEEFTFFLTSPESSLLDISVWDKDNYRKDDFIGRCDLDLWSLTREKTHSLKLNLVDTPGTLLLLVTVHSVTVPEDHVTQYDLSQIRHRYALSSSFNELSDVGFAELRIISASGVRSADINGKSDPFCVVQLCNARAQTHTCYRTLDPAWHRSFNFSLLDIHDVFDLWVFDQDQKEEREFLGRVCIPILRCKNGEPQTFYLKDRKLKQRVKGSITVQVSYIFNPVRAAVRTFSPREEIFMEETPKFKKALLLQNFSRVWRILQRFIAAAEFINSCFTWQNKSRSLIAFIMFLLIVWNFELYMIPIILLMLLMKNYVDIFIRKTRPPRHLMNAEEAQRADGEEEEDEDESKPSILQRLRALEEVLIKVQLVLDKIASLGERVYNTFAWSVPFLGWVLVVVLCVLYLVLYFIPLRVIVLLWGINKFTKRLRKPNFVPNNEVLDFLSRVPSNVQLDEYREFQPESSPTHTKKKR